MGFSSDPSTLVNQLPVSIVLPKKYEEAHEILSLLFKQITDAVNKKEGSLYSLSEFGNFQRYSTSINSASQEITFKNVYRKVFDMVSLNGGSILAGATASFPHNISGIISTTNIYGSATNSDAPVHYLPLPYVSQTATKNIEIYLTSSDVVLVNGSTQSALTSCTIVAEYLKQ